MIARLILAALVACALPAGAQQAPKPVWIADVKTGCRVYYSEPDPKVSIKWSGACANGYLQGRGVLQWYVDRKPVRRDEGEWRAGKQNGSGTSIRTDGTGYVGEFRDDNYNGHGSYTLSGGGGYEGEWRDDLPNGHGTYTTKAGAVYTGNWTNGCFRQGDRWATFLATKEECGFH